MAIFRRAIFRSSLKVSTESAAGVAIAPPPPDAPIFAGPVPVPQKQPVAIVEPLADAAFCEEYAAVALELGYSTPQLKQGAFQRFLSERGVSVYDRAKVSAYLDAQYGPPKARPGNGAVATWGWRPLTPGNSPIDSDDGAVATAWGGGFVSWNWTANGSLMAGVEPYQKPIPMPVLLTAQAIKRAFPDARFYVSDEVHERDAIRDPFLLVRFEGVSYIVERWDEPSFRG